jgi:hypothetical protein
VASKKGTDTPLAFYWFRAISIAALPACANFVVTALWHEPRRQLLVSHAEHGWQAHGNNQCDHCSRPPRHDKVKCKKTALIIFVFFIGCKNHVFLIIDPCKLPEGASCGVLKRRPAKAGGDCCSRARVYISSMGCCFSSEEEQYEYDDYTGMTDDVVDKDDTDFTQIDVDSFDSKFRRCEQLGVGQSCVVYRVVHKRTGEEFACKVMEKERNCPQHCWCRMHQKVREEVSTLKKMDHPHIFKLHAVFETSSNIYIVSLVINPAYLQPLSLSHPACERPPGHGAHEGPGAILQYSRERHIL